MKAKSFIMISWFKMLLSSALLGFGNMESCILFMTSGEEYVILRILGIGLERNEPVASVRLCCE